VGWHNANRRDNFPKFQVAWGQFLDLGHNANTLDESPSQLHEKNGIDLEGDSVKQKYILSLFGIFRRRLCNGVD
jgi:hypothetical protein